MKFPFYFLAMAMASLSSLPHSLHSSPSTSSANYVIPSKPPCPKRLRFGSSNRRHTKSFAPRAAVDEVSVLEPPPPQPPSSGSKTTPNPELVASLKLNLLSAVSGLNRGLAASGEDLQKAEAAAKEIEAAGGPVDLSTDLDKLQGRWKLIYSSAFSSRTLGGSRPGPPTGRLLPITLGQVFQRIDIFSKDFDNIVELELGAPWPLPPVEATATLAHKFELIGSSRVKIIFEKTTVKTTGNLSQLPPLELPKLPEGLRPPSNPGSGEFDVTYLDADIRITRGDRDELRVFVVS
ncbi:probable plastid-lipid-associated protein 6, chloroplastic precursor [Malus domestica]|uniref:Harpin binding protein 1 n=2 Tax=Malus domestica TaxID=3750 RepID=Q5QJB3_MALDO|nr:probable plastid-lipid-associated protein 6, chloroplastic precursor [Malus domestica]AAR26482.1 harpin binding protein 1 [Malus domestica]